jgi:hypothetical protein
VAESISAGDVVLHKPSGETWLVLGVSTPRGELVPMGWPPSVERLADCMLVERRPGGVTREARRYRIEKWGRWFDDDREEDERMDREWAL